MKQLSRTELSIIKRINASTKALERNKATRLKKMEVLQNEIDDLNEQIEALEAPVKQITGGLTSAQYLDTSIEALPTADTTPNII